MPELASSYSYSTCTCTITGIKRGAVKGSFEVDLMDLYLELVFTIYYVFTQDSLKIQYVCLTCV